MHQRVETVSLTSSVFWTSDCFDPAREFSSAASFSADNDTGSRHLKIMWGRFYKDSIECEATAWSGSFSLDRGTEISQREVRFVSDQDFLPLPAYRKSTGCVFRTAIYDDGRAVDTVTTQPIPVLDFTDAVDVSHEYEAVVTTVVDVAYLELDPAVVVDETAPLSSTFTRGRDQCPYKILEDE